jgi:hypothetical protein
MLEASRAAMPTPEPVKTHQRASLSQGGAPPPLPQSRSIIVTMKTLAVVFALALAAMAFEVYSDVSLTSADFSHTKARDPAAVAIAHGVKRR